MRTIYTKLKSLIFKRSLKERVFLLALVTPFVFAASLLQQPEPAHSETKNRPIIVLTENSPASYLKNPTGVESGWYYDLIQNWAEKEGIELEFKVVSSKKEILDLLRSGVGDIGLGIFETADENYKDLLRGPEIDSANLDLVCRRYSFPAEGETIKVLLPPSAYIYKLVESELGEIDHYMSFNSEENAMALMQKVSKGEFDCAVVNSIQSQHNIRFFADLHITHHFEESFPTGWLVSSQAPDLNQSIWNWASEFKKDELWSKIWKRYFSYQQSMNNFETLILQRRVKSRLPKFRKTFQAAAKHYDLPWQLVAAVSYQESHWSPTATSYTGVRGIMQLTMGTAEYLGVDNRLDVGQSIWGGTKYLRMLIDRTPVGIHYRDRLAMALAAYNVGWGHVEDARKMALDMGKDPNAWSDLKDILPLLAEHKYHSKTRYGYARGWEPVVYVERIRNYFDVLGERSIR